MSGSGDTVDLASVTLSPSDTSADVALNVPVTASFSATITEPSDWTQVVTLKKDGTGDNLCTAVSYDSSTLTATCTHVELESGDYTASISGLSGVTDTTSTFTTGSEIAVTMGKTTVASTSTGNDVALTFTFASAVPSDWPLTVQVTDPDSTELTVSGCEFNGDRTSYSCTVGGIDGCTTFSDYTVTVTGTGESTTTFNSADDEFESEDALSDCWVQTGVGATLSITADQTLSMVVPPTIAITLDKGFSGVGDIAVLTAISTVDRPTASGDEDASIVTILRDEPDNRSLGFGPTNYAGVDKLNLGLITGSGSYGASPIGGGSLAQTSTSDGPFYVCMARYNNTVKTYLSTDGINYTRLSSDNVTCHGCAIGLNAIVEASADWATVARLRGHNEVPNATLSGEYDYVRFKTTGITGESSADCPAL